MGTDEQNGHDDDCPVCGSSMYWEDCNDCGGEGYRSVDYDEEDGGDDGSAGYGQCITCDGRGGFWLCLNFKNHPETAAPQLKNPPWPTEPALAEPTSVSEMMDTYRRETPDGKQAAHQMIDEIIAEKKIEDADQ